MKYTIHGFSQSVAIQLGMDNDDLLILRWIVDFSQSGKMNHVYKNDRMYYWIHYDSLLKDIPILRMKKDTLYRRLKKMAASDVLSHMTVKNKKGVYSYYGLGNKYYNLINNNNLEHNYYQEYEEEPIDIEGSDLNPIGVGNKSEGGRIKIPNKDNSTNNYSTNDKNILSKKERKEKEVEKAEAKKDVKVNKGEVYPNEELQNVENIEELQIVEVKEDKKKTMTLKDKNHSQSENNIKIETIKNCNSNYTTSKSKNQETHEEIIRKFTKDEELIDLLKEYLVMRYVQNNKKALTNRQLKLLLTKLLKLSEKEDEQKEIVSNALMGGYKRFFGLDDKEQGKPAKNMPERHKTANGSEIKPYDLTQRQLEYAKELYEKQERDQGKKVSNSDLFYNWLEN